MSKSELRVLVRPDARMRYRARTHTHTRAAVESCLFLSSDRGGRLLQSRGGVPEARLLVPLPKLNRFTMFALRWWHTFALCSSGSSEEQQDSLLATYELVSVLAALSIDARLAYHGPSCLLLWCVHPASGSCPRESVPTVISSSLATRSATSR